MISMNWVKDYVDLDGIDLKDLAVKITQAGVNVEKVITNHIDNLVIGEVIECKSIPDTHLHDCLVDVGNSEPQKIVCGAPNVREGLKVIVALPGAKLPDGEIKASKIRGHESNGMLCALFELGLEPKTEENYNKGICELPSDAPVGKDPIDYLGLEDTLYDLDVHKHRNNDCYYHIGFAYEVATILNKKVKLPKIKYTIDKKDNISSHLKIEVKTDKCTYYSGKYVKNVTIKESPDFIKKRLNAVGMRSINNVVDISNYVMLEFGQPTHFFDADKLGDKILVRDAKENEKLVTLDGKERILSPSDIVITDGEKPICLAGVMGGENTEVDDNTKNIFIEAAIFNPVSIRYTARNHNLPSEASIRYGKGLNYEYTQMALDRCVELLEKYADGKVIDGEVLYDNEDKSEKTIDFTTDKINKLLGIEISTKDMEHELDRLDFKYSLKGNNFHVIIPRRRLDIDPYVNDMAEEIGRLYGYHNLKSTLPVIPDRRGIYVGDVLIRKNISRRLRSLGLNEARTYTLVSPSKAKLFNYENKEQKVLPNPMSVDKSVMRTTLIPSLIDIYEYNKARKVDNILLYEISKTYDINYNEDSKVCMLIEGNYIESKWNNTIIKADFYTLKGIVNNLLIYLGFKNRISYAQKEIVDMHPGQSAEVLIDRKPIGVIGRVHPSLYKDPIYVCEISMTKLYNMSVKPLKYKEASKYPLIEKDVAFVVDNNITNEEIVNLIKKSGGRLLTNVDIFDIYRDIEPGKKSMAYNLIFSDQTRTLSDEEVMKVFNKIIDYVCDNLHARLRDS